jgi:hypothetical protein
MMVTNGQQAATQQPSNRAACPLTSLPQFSLHAALTAQKVADNVSNAANVVLKP